MITLISLSAFAYNRGYDRRPGVQLPYERTGVDNIDNNLPAKNYYRNDGEVVPMDRDNTVVDDNRWRGD